MHPYNQPSCSIQFIDCAGYYDLIAQFISIIFIFIILLFTFNNYRYLRQEQLARPEKEIEKSLKRKIIVNLVSIVYQITLLVTVLFSIMLFLVYKNNKHEIKQYRLNQWYKWSQIIFINFLNILNLTVGFLYWKAARAYFKMAEQHIPWIYSNIIKFMFVLVYILNVVIIIISLALLIRCSEAIYSNQDIITINYLNTLSVTLSSLMCLISRVLYQKDILNTIKMSHLAIKKQAIYSILIGFCCICRITTILFNLFQMDYTEFFRQFDQNCIDYMPYHAILMFFITLVVNLLPPTIFSVIFSSVERKRKYTSEIKERLMNEQGSIQNLGDKE